MKIATLAATATLWSLAGAAAAFEVRPELSARGWFFSAEGMIENTDLDQLGFDQSKGQPEIKGGLVLARRHHIEVWYLRVRRSEQGTVSGQQVFGVIPSTPQQLSVDLSVDYVRGHYGYSLLSNSLLDLEPFLEIGYLHEDTDIVGSNRSARSNESRVFPLPGLELVVAPAYPVRLRARAAGIGTGFGHLVDVEGGAEAAIRFVFAGLGYRHVDFRVENNSGRDVADLRLNGIYVQAGLRF